MSQHEHDRTRKTDQHGKQAGDAGKPPIHADERGRESGERRHEEPAHGGAGRHDTQRTEHAKRSDPERERERR